MPATVTKEAQNQTQIDTYKEKGPITFGPWTSHIWRHDPRHLGFLLARYKFCAKMLAGRDRALEVGCGDACGTPITLQTVGHVHAIDFEPLVLTDAQERYAREGIAACSFEVVDLTAKTPRGSYDAAYSLDVIEHIPPDLEEAFMINLCAALHQHSMCILGTPNVSAAQYASEASQVGHVNLKSAQTLADLLANHFHHVLMFSMNDEVVHTGYYPMAHYLLGVGVEKK